ncbi:Stk1 family PASTA domain-containing Ser/Thr kinase [Paenibacillus phyllosphaerae]|nr:Stk1 family PASTA domain-containing Ser/Thr kinase [Paenibacillus phyllosphaerae]
MIGHELGGRYEIITRVGGGGMALVYKAHDILLNRNVAVKILRQQYTHDEEFIRRFRREAQSAAALSHPNVVSIYDVGQEGETQYIVMEYIEGQNLNEVILERAPLQADEAVHIALQICDALEHAHHNQIIHRDIKPHNILIGKNGRVKVTDFGIARAVTSSTITQTGSVLGSVHYFSPEHAKGVSTGEKSDLYSLGIVLYQMLTGQLPFLGESPISVALKHLQETFEEPRKVNPYIPQSVENIILKAMRKNPGDRYSSATEMLRDLETCLSPNRLNEPKITFSSDHADFEETRVMPAIRGNIAEPSLPQASTGRTETVAESVDNRSEAKGTSEQPRKRKWIKPVSIVASTLIIIGLVFWGAQTVLSWFEIEEVDVPYVVGKTEEEAVAELEKVGLKLQVPTVYMEKDIPEGQVYDQSPSNQRVKVGAAVKLFVSSGPHMEQLSNYVGKSYAGVKEELLALGITEDRIESESTFNDELPAGTIIEQTPAAGAEFDPRDATFSFIVSKGKETFSMPNLIGMTEKAAIELLQSKGLEVDAANTVREPSYGEKGKVIAQHPYSPKDEVSKGSVVTLTVSDGLPEDALRYTFNINISPAVAGQESKIRIVYSDARGEKIEWGQKTINDWQNFPIEVILAPNTEAVVEVYRDKQFVDTFTKTYEDIKSGSDSMPQTVPGIEEPIEDEPAATNETGNDNGGEDAGEQQQQ